MANATQTITTSKVDLYQQVTDTIIQQLEAGTVPWHKPWQDGAGASLALPLNPTTGKHYQGINIVLLWSSADAKQLPCHEWASFKQWSEKKEFVRKGEKGTMIVYYDTLEKELEGELTKIPFIKSSYVFNRSQLQSYTPALAENQPFEERLPIVDQFINQTGADIFHHHGGACYMPVTDRIGMPFAESFIDTPHRTRLEGYYSILSHELVHWTGHPNRLDRVKGKKFGDQTYAAEELIAELGAAFLCAELQITSEPKPDHATYINNWLTVLKENKTFIVKTASEASKAVGYLKGLQPA